MTVDRPRPRRINSVYGLSIKRVSLPVMIDQTS